MMQRVVDNIIAVTKESVKTFTYESLNHIVRLINGVSALLLTFLPGKANILEGIHGWELRPPFGDLDFRAGWKMECPLSIISYMSFLWILILMVSSLDYPYGDEGSSDGDTSPGSPLSQSSRVSRASSFSRNDRHWMGWMWIRYIFFWILLPARFLIGILVPIFQSSYSRSSNGSSAPGSSQVLQARAINRMQTLKDHIVHRTTDRRRGVIEDLHLAIEIFIEAIFDVVHKAAHFILSPSEAFKTLSGWYSLSSSGVQDSHDSDSEVSVPTATLGENDPAPKERNTSFQQSLNTDARTCQDVITELGYPYEAIHVITSDGYVLLLERLPRRDSRKAVYLQHGILDSSMGWVSNGVVGSPAFAAYDQGYDVFLGNFRGLVSREHVNKNISSRQYWQYSINEHATQDIPAMIEKIHQVKTAELKLSQPDLEEEINDEQPYKLCAICHSLGGAAILMYVVTQRIEERPHRLQDWFYCHLLDSMVIPA
ncbi:uncharacterized protein Pyn_22764 [Prunus yedoensis var. nudiflora]|uniref:Partial AB-hydrolase lipase domain-containing protein n=1 Tax=Prunus yedoensis var. nudiflora TaxID=2094558 RepID=A0A314XMB9_PRUYE|nr:uncharacterized protein Pyn_22764 [Prunus yedoensis var. nudiflora]